MQHIFDAIDLSLLIGIQPASRLLNITVPLIQKYY